MRGDRPSLGPRRSGTSLHGTSRAVIAASLVGHLLCARSAAAETQQGLDLVWRAPPGCPSREFVQGRIRELLGESAERATHLHVQGEIERTRGRFRLTLSSRDDVGSSKRVIEADSCADLAGAAAVAIGLLIRVELESRGAETPSAALPTKSAAAGQSAAPEQNAAETPAQSGPARTRRANTGPRTPESAPGKGSRNASSEASDEGYPRFLVQAPLVGIDFGPLPEPRPTLGLALGLQLPSWDVSLGAHTSAAQTTWASGVPRYGAELSRATLTLQACQRWAFQQLEGGPCIHLAVDRLTGRGVGEELQSRTQHVLVFAAGGGALGRWRVSQSVGVILSIAGQYEASRPRLRFNGLSELEQLAAFGLSVKSGLEWSW